MFIKDNFKFYMKLFSKYYNKDQTWISTLLLIRSIENVFCDGPEIKYSVGIVGSVHFLLHSHLGFFLSCLLLCCNSLENQNPFVAFARGLQHGGQNLKSLSIGKYFIIIIDQAPMCRSRQLWADGRSSRANSGGEEALTMTTVLIGVNPEKITRDGWMDAILTRINTWKADTWNKSTEWQIVRQY